MFFLLFHPLTMANNVFHPSSGGRYAVRPAAVAAPKDAQLTQLLTLHIVSEDLGYGFAFHGLTCSVDLCHWGRITYYCCIAREAKASFNNNTDPT